MKRLISIIGIPAAALFLFLNCGGGGSGDGSGVGDLQGTWLGWIEDDGGNVEEFSLDIDGSGKVLDGQIGASPIGTGHINEGYDENVFHVLYSGGLLGHGIMIIDDQGSHAVYGDYGSLSSNYYIGVLEKGADSSPAYTIDDIVASYSVVGAYEGSSGLWEGDNITMTVGPAPALTITGTSPDGPFSGSFDTYDSDYGLYTGSLTSMATTMDIQAFVSPDGTAAAAFVSDAGTTPDYIEDFILVGLKK
jgi:hypothetical protein